jgi:type IV pilus assembly protein PilA
MVRDARRGYTLMELLVVVAMVGILATLAVIGVRKYIFASKTSEAIHMIGSIKAAQEAYKDETFSYLNVSTSNTYYPMPSPGRQKYHWIQPHADAGRWQELGANPGGPVQFGYQTTAGAAGTAVVAPPTQQNLNFPAAPTEPWYVVFAASDLDENGVQSLYVSSSFTNEIYSEREGE